MSETSHDTLSIRLTQILIKFNSGEKLCVNDLAEEFNVSVRTIQRDFQKMSYLPIEKEGNYYYLPEYCLGKLNFNDIKQFATFSGIRELYPELNDGFIVDLLNAKVNNSVEVKGLNYENLSHKVEMFNDLGGAIVSQQCIGFVYNDKQREVHPYRLINTHGIWYLAGVERGVLKHFTFSKIISLSSIKETFSKDEAVVTLLNENKGMWVTQTPIEVELEVDAEVAEYFLRRSILPYQKVLEKTPEKLILFAKIAYEEELFQSVRYWIPHITIRSPKHLQKKLEDSLKKYLKKSLS